MKFKAINNKGILLSYLMPFFSYKTQTIITPKKMNNCSLMSSETLSMFSFTQCPNNEFVGLVSVLQSFFLLYFTS